MEERRAHLEDELDELLLVARLREHAHEDVEVLKEPRVVVVGPFVLLGVAELVAVVLVLGVGDARALDALERGAVEHWLGRGSEDDAHDVEVLRHCIDGI
mgnify:CR=1 FL=1